jgi:predicted permease
MSLWSRFANVFRSDRITREIEEEMRAHIEEATEQGRDPKEARRAFGSMLRQRERSRDLRLIPWLDSLRADAVFGWRQLKKRKVTSAAAILSLALAIGACTSGFRLIDALLLRPLPVAGSDRLYSATFESPSAVDNTPVTYDSCSYPMFQRMRADMDGQAEAIAVSLFGGPTDLTYGSDEDTERVNVQYVSGWMFDTFGLHPAAGRLLHANDDLRPGAHPLAVLSYDYWDRRFGRNPNVVGHTFRMGQDIFEIVGVAEHGFTGTETGWVMEIFIPMAMKNPRTLASLNNFWLRTLLVLKPGVDPGPLQEKLRATFHSIQEERVKGFPAQSIRDRERMFAERLSLEPASAGRSNMQRDYRRALIVLGLLVALVLLIACANVANLMTAQAASRAREMALRVSIGAGRWRLVQLVLVESAWLTILATAIGWLFAWWSAPFILGMMNFGGYAVRLVLPADWRVLGFGVALACGVTLIFGLAPALRSSAIRPASALRGGDQPLSRGRLMSALIAIQVAFCLMVHLAASLLVATFQHLSNQPNGFVAERVLNLEAVTSSPQSPILWEQVAEHLRATLAVEKVALSGWPLMSGESAVGNISIDGAPPSDVFSDFYAISPGWAELMRIPLLSGRDFRAGDVNPGVAIVNQAFAKQYFDRADPAGKWFDRVSPAGGRQHFQIVGLIRDARSRDRLRWPIRPTAYIPFPSVDASGALQFAGRGTFVVRTASSNPLAIAAALRQAVGHARPGFRVRQVSTQAELIQAATVQERLLALLASFFAGVAVLLAGVGLYGVLDYSVIQRRKEIGIRVAIGAPARLIARSVIQEMVAAVLAGSLAGLGCGIALVRYVETLLYGVKWSDPAMLAIPCVTIGVAAIVAAIPAITRALKIDPAVILRAE